VRFHWCLEDPWWAELPGNHRFWIVRPFRAGSFLAAKAVAAGADSTRGHAGGVDRPSASTWRVRTEQGRTLLAGAVVIADGARKSLQRSTGLGAPSPVRLALR